MAQQGIIPGTSSLPAKWDLTLGQQTKDCGNCCRTTTCLCLGCTPCLIADLGDSLGHDWCLSCCLLGTITPLFFFRLEIMKKRNIPYTPCCCCKVSGMTRTNVVFPCVLCFHHTNECAEWWRLCFCTPCALCQMQHEVKLIKQSQQDNAPGAQAIVR